MSALATPNRRQFMELCPGERLAGRRLIAGVTLTRERQTRLPIVASEVGDRTSPSRPHAPGRPHVAVGRCVCTRAGIGPGMGYSGGSLGSGSAGNAGSLSMRSEAPKSGRLDTNR